MIPYPHISPVIVRIGPLEIRWYGLMYLLGFVTSYILFQYQIKKKKIKSITKETVENLYFWLILALILGARLGYVLFYNLPYYIENPLKVFAVWQGGMSFHGGLIGSIIAGIIFCRKNNIDFWQLADLFVPTTPPGLAFGRLGNFINGELFGRPSNVPWAMIFPGGGDIPRHPSQLYEAFLEGIFLFTVIWVLKDRLRTKGMVLSVFIILYGFIRFMVEFTREPDPQLGYVLGPFTMGQILSFSMMAAGFALAVWRKRAAGKETGKSL
ncbi:MAG: prolipoprotein diacylglyceryl transferase [Nitrospiraceae bacterium]|nr:prolipoprotein diacylglyceryl transferase [Nitrospiraceae bacterium]